LVVTIEPTVENARDLRIRLAGELDMWSAATLARMLTALRPSARASGARRWEIVLDLHELTFIDTSGLTALDEARNGLTAAGWYVTIGPAQPQVCRLIRFAQRSGWLASGPLAAEDSSTSHVHITPASAEQGGRPRSVTVVNYC
jgi:anti-anti-sigma factor